MVVSVNSKPNLEDFHSLLKKTVSNLEKEALEKTDDYLKLLGRKLEDKVFDLMKANAIGTPFWNSIELISGQKFPDIIAKKYYGVEVKSTKQNHWKSTH